MKGDEISFEAKKDLLIVHFGESYLKKHKRERKEYAASSRMRELSKLLIAFRNVLGVKNISFKDILKPKYFDAVLAATRKLSGYDPINKIYITPSLAMHIGTYLKQVCDELQHLILKEASGFTCQSQEEMTQWRKDISNFKSLVESRWNIEISSLANKDLQQKRWSKPLLMPLISDIQIFKEETLKIANECQDSFLKHTDHNETYKRLVNCTLALLILFNRRRIGDVQYLKTGDYTKESITNCKDFENTLSETEKVLTKKYKRVVNSGKGSRAVVILVPEVLQQFIDTLLNSRDKYIPSSNEYLFAVPGSKIKWGQGDVAIRNLTKNMDIQHPEAISSNKLRKHIATVAQILSLTKEEAKQFSQFMGHTEKTHSEFYELPIDIYQTAKVSKLLLMMEKGSLPLKYKGKSLSDIIIDDEDFKYPEEDLGYEARQQSSSSAAAENPTDKAQEGAIERKKTKIFLENDTEISSSEIPEKRKRESKKGWTNLEIKLLEAEFGKNIESKTYPKSADIKAFINRTKINRTALVIKSKLQHLMKK